MRPQSVTAHHRSGSLPLLLAIDIQNGFVVPASAPVVPTVAALVDEWLAVDAPVILTRYLNHSGSPFQRLLGWHAMTSAPDTDIVTELAHHARNPRVQVIDKTTYSALTPETAETITHHRVSDVFLCGIATDACVLATALALFDHGLTPWIITDACASNTSRHPPQQIHDAALLLMSRLLGSSQLIDIDRAQTMLRQTLTQRHDPAPPITVRHESS
ncbi:cysteine hydrolase [Nocardia sp. NBC_01730]|uniref:cysteine hydrolase family protein n=1 Tax=Nocardia sp. NBC_01730 TaxID=2975998 RepID=UPI002E0ED763|nr:cysteine hydrolase [Nocardia sp. NBC_01730]